MPALRSRWDSPNPQDQQAANAAWKAAETGGGAAKAGAQREHGSQMWDKASEVLATVTHQRGAVAPSDHAAWSTAASDTAGRVGGPVGRTGSTATPLRWSCANSTRELLRGPTPG